MTKFQKQYGKSKDSRGMAFYYVCYIVRHIATGRAMEKLYACKAAGVTATTLAELKNKIALIG